MVRQVTGELTELENRRAGVRRAGRRGGFALFALIARALQQVSTFVVTLLAARFLLPAEYGIYSLGIVFIALIQSLTYTGFYHFIVTSKDSDDDVLSTGFWMITGVATISAAILAAAALPIAWLFKAPELGPVLLLLALIQPLAGVGAWYSAALLRQRAVKVHFSIMFFQNLCALIGGVVLLWLWQSLFALVAFRYVRVLSGTVLYLAFAHVRLGFRFDRALARRATGFSGGLYGSRLLNFLSRYSGDLLLGLMFTTAEAGLYRFGNRVATGATDIVSQPMNAFALTQFGATARQGRNLSGTLERFAGGITLLTGGVAATIIVIGSDVVATYFHPAYLAALTVTYAVAVRSVMATAIQMLEPALAAAGRTGIAMIFNLGNAAIMTTAVVLAAPFGLTILAWTQTAAVLVLAISALIVLKRYASIEIRGACYAIVKSGLLVLIYGLILKCVHLFIFEKMASTKLDMALFLVSATVLGLLVLCAGWRLKVFSLNIFSG